MSALFVSLGGNIMVGDFTYVDIGILAVLAIFLIIGFKKGFIDTILGLVGGLVSLVVAVLLAGTVADMLYPLFGMGNAIEGSMNGFLANLLNPEGIENSVFTSPIGAAENISALVHEAISKLGLPATFTDSISASLSESITAAIAGSEAAVIAEKSLVQILAPVLTRVIMLVIAVIATFIVIRIIVSIIEAITKAILRTSRSLRSIDRLLGAIAGVAKGLLLVVIIFTIGFFVLSGVEPNSENTDIKSQVRTSIEESQIGNFIYHNNPVPKLITDNINFDNILNGLLGIFNGNETPPPAEQSPDPTDDEVEEVI